MKAMSKIMIIISVLIKILLLNFKPIWDPVMMTSQQTDSLNGWKLKRINPERSFLMMYPSKDLLPPNHYKFSVTNVVCLFFFLPETPHLSATQESNWLFSQAQT